MGPKSGQKQRQSLSRQGGRSPKPGLSPSDLAVTPRQPDDTTGPSSDEPSLAFRVLSEEQTNLVIDAMASGDVIELQNCLKNVINVDDEEHSLKSGIRLDYYVSAVWWARKEKGFSKEQLSAFYAVIHTLLTNLTEKCQSLSDNLLELKKMLVGVGLTRMPQGQIAGGLQRLFNVQQTNDIIDYVQMSLFQHYRLYEIFSKAEQKAEEREGPIILSVLPMDVVDTVPPLCEAIEEKLYVEYLWQQKVHWTDEVEKEEDEEEEESLSFEDQLLSRIPPDVVCDVIESVYKEMLTEFNDEIQSLLVERANALIARINGVRVVKQGN